MWYCEGVVGEILGGGHLTENENRHKKRINLYHKKDFKRGDMMGVGGEMDVAENIISLDTISIFQYFNGDFVK